MVTAPPAGLSYPMSGETVLKLLAGLSDSTSAWKTQTGTVHRLSTQPDRTAMIWPKTGGNELLGDDVNDYVTITGDDFVPPQNHPDYSPRIISEPGAANRSSEPDHELFMRRKDRVARALPQQADSFRPFGGAAYRSPRAPAASRSSANPLANPNAPPVAYGTTTFEAFPRYAEYLSPRQRKPYEDTPRMMEQDIEYSEHAMPVYHKGHAVLAALTQTEVGDSATHTGTARRTPTGGASRPSPRSRYLTETAQRYGWPQVTEATAICVSPPSGQGMGLIS